MNVIAEELIEAAHERVMRGEKPASTLGYCSCCTVWNMVELGLDCPDCGEPPVYIERSTLDLPETVNTKAMADNVDDGRPQFWRDASPKVVVTSRVAELEGALRRLVFAAEHCPHAGWLETARADIEAAKAVLAKQQ